MWSSFRQRFRSALRYKLLALVLLPLSLAMLATLGYTLYWFHGYSRDSLNFAMRDDLILARQALRQLQDEHQTELQKLADAAAFRSVLQRGRSSEVQRTLRRLRDARGLSFLHVTGVAGNWLFEDVTGFSKPSPLTDRAGRGFAGAALEVFRAGERRREGSALTMPGERGGEERGLVLRMVQPIQDERGFVSMVLDAAVLLNGNSVVMDAVRKRVFAADTQPPGADPMVALLLDDRRIATSESATSLLGTKATTQQWEPLGDSGDAWIGSDRLGDHVYRVGYSALYDVNGQHVGMLQIGVRESAYHGGYYRTVGVLLGMFATVTLLAAWLAVRGVRSIVTPIEAMAAVARATAEGEDRRIGPIRAQDEVGQLAHQFDAMLDQLAARNREIQRSASALEIKVAERTGELAQKNAELERTIVLLEKTRNQLVLAEKLSALGQMAAGIAHEINNPAAVILGNLDVLSAELGAQAQPVSREIELIAQQVERIRHIVMSLLQFARARPGEGPIVDVGVNQLVDDVLPLVTHVLKGKSIVLRRRLRARGMIAIDRFDLEQVLINLIVNAANACTTGGVIEITTADEGDGGATISVRDNGCGISRELLERVFDPFFTTNLNGGTGLGLSVSYGIVRRYGGQISVESTPGAGSVFHVRLQRRPEPMASDRATTQLEEMHHG